jgi:predicted transposase YdaD
MVYIQDVEQAYESWVMARRAEGKLEGKIEGKLEGEIALTVKQLTRKFDGLSSDLVEKVNLLSLERVEELGVALLDFDCVDDLVGWLG